jgi:exodeoxyribonuclease VII large subunit
MLNILTRRAPYLEVILVPVRVQGIGAAEEIAEAIGAVNRHLEADLLIVGRGGGSIEDLWAFNEEVVARAIFGSEIPVVSAVGHETDFTIADFVADLRAPTPSAAAELSAPDKAEIVESLANYSYTGKQLLDRRIAAYRDRITGYVRSHALNRPLDIVRQYLQRLDEIRAALGRTTFHRIAIAREQLDGRSRHLRNLNPESILSRGYVIVSRDGAPIVKAAAVSPDDLLDLRFADGQVGARAVSVEGKRARKAETANSADSAGSR